MRSALSHLDSTRASIPENHVTRLIAAKRLDLSEPLRWRGRLREDPLVLPWGRRFEIDLERVESSGQFLAASGGLRANLYNNPRQSEEFSTVLRAGDRVECLIRARAPRNFLDPGAFDLHGYLARQKIDLIGSLRSGELLQVIDRQSPTFLQQLARMRGNLLARLDALFANQPDQMAVLRAMLLGDRAFVDSETVTAFQKTAAYHVLVVAGLHVGALAVFFFWLGRKLRLSVSAAILVTFFALAAYVGMVQDRPPLLRAALRVALYLCARPFFRRVELLNTIALTALLILFWKPSLLADSSFDLSFLAAGVIAALALPWMDRTSAPYRAGLAGSRRPALMGNRASLRRLAFPGAHCRLAGERVARDREMVQRVAASVISNSGTSGMAVHRIFCCAALPCNGSPRSCGASKRPACTPPVAPSIRPAEWISAFVLAALTLLVAAHPFAPALNRGKLEVTVLDVGQGDSIFAGFPDGRTMLIDGGGQPGSEWVGGQRSGIDIGEQVVSPYLWSRGIQQLDVIALTPHITIILTACTA